VQVHDLNGGIHKNGLFWTVGLGWEAFSMTGNGNRAQFRAKGVPLSESFEFAGPNVVPATADIQVTWQATAAAETRGLGDSVEPTDPGAFLGTFAEADAAGSVSAEILGFSFRGQGTSDEGWAELGTERNGILL
jgi:hypothetical protein